MFSLLHPENAALILTLISYLGFFTTGCVGFSVLQTTDFDINYFLICLSSLIFGICFIVLELIYYLKYEFMASFKNIYYLRTILLFVTGTFILGITKVGLTFGLIGITSAILNLFIGIFADEECEDRMRLNSNGEEN